MTFPGKLFVYFFVSFVLTVSTVFAWTVPVYAQEWSDLSADADGDGLPNVTEENGWYNEEGGPFYTDPLDADSDNDGLPDGREKLYDTDPLDDRSPGIYVEYEQEFQTKQYYPWQRYGNNYIALPSPFSPWDEDAAVVRRGTVFSVGGPADADIEIDKSISELTTLTAERDPCAGRWRIYVPEDGTVGIYTITVEDGSWSESLDLYVIFQWPAGLSDAFIDAFVYDDDPDDVRDTTSLGYYEGAADDKHVYDNEDYDWIPEEEWINHGFVWRYDTQHYADFVFQDHVMPAINGYTDTLDAANALGQRADEVTCFGYPRPLGTSWCVLNPSSCGPDYNNKNQCTNIANLLASFNRAAGIPSRPMFTDWQFSTFDHSTEVWTKPTWGAWDWYVMRGYDGDEGSCPDPNYTGGYDPVQSTSGWYSSGWGVYAGGENWTWSDTGDGDSSDADEFRLASWQFDKDNQVGQIIKKDWFETRFVDYWNWPSEPEVIGTPPDDWPDPPGSTMAAFSEADLSTANYSLYFPIILNGVGDSTLTSVFQFGRVAADYGVDLDDDGRFEQLVFDVQVEVKQAGTYWFWGRLAGGFSEAIGSAYLEKGRHTIALPFDGIDIYLNKVDGPYILDALWATDVENPAPIDFIENELGYAQPAYETAPYEFSDFGVAGAILTNEYSHEAIDTHGDEYPDALIVETNLKVEKVGLYTVQGVLYVGQDETPVQASWTGYGPRVTLQFDGLRDTTGPYTLAHLSVRNAAGRVTDGTIEPYALGEVSELRARPIHLGAQATVPADPSEIKPTFIITGTGYSDAGVDTDSDGKFDQLVITVNVEVESGEGGQEYRVEGWLADANGSLISWAMGDSQVLAEGTQTLSLAFDGRLINEHGVDGPFTLTALKALSGGTYSVLDAVDVAYTTLAYDYDAFEEAAVSPATIHFDDDLESWIVEGDSFEAGVLDAAWTTYSSTTEGRIQVTGDYGTARGTYALLMDDDSDDTYTLNEAIWTVDLSGVSEAYLSFSHAEWGDEQHSFDGDFVGNYNADGVAISDDGTNWHPVLDAPDQAEGVWQRYTIDLAAEAAAASMTLGPNFQVKFQQYDDYPLDTGPDGRGWDEIVIVGEGSPGDQWEWESPWGLNTDVQYSYSHAWEADASGSQSGSLTATASVDLSAYALPTLRLQTCYSMQSSNDRGYVEVSTNGLDWTRAVTYTDSTSHWSTELIDLSDWGETENVQFRFNADSQTSLLWYVDDVYLNAWPAVTSASFDHSPKPVLTTEDTTFVASYSSITTTPPVTYTWYFDDGSPAAVTNTPTITHRFPAGATYAVQLVVENPYDSATFTATLSVYEPVVETSFDYSPPTPGTDTWITFTATHTPSSATAPITYTWDLGDSTTVVTTTQAITHRYSTSDDYVVELTTANPYGTAVHTRTITVNNPPDAMDDLITTDEDIAITAAVLGNDSDPDGDTLTIISIGTASNGTATFSSDVVTYTPDADYFGSDTFTYTISDDNGSNDTAIVNVTVTSVNDDPTAADDSATVVEDSSDNTIDVLANDDDAPDTGETLIITGVGMAGHGTVVFSSGVVTYTPDADYFGSDNFTYTIDDGNGGSATATVSITVTNVNDDPTANDDSVAVAEDSGANTIDVLANDDDAPDTGETLTIVGAGAASHGTVVFSSGTVTYTPDADYFGSDSFTYTINDGNGGSATATVNLAVTNVNDDPTANDDNVAVAEDSGANTMDVLANDDDAPDTGETLTITGVGVASHGAVVFSSDVITYTPNADYFGSDSFSYIIGDGNGGSDTALLNILINPVNDEPDAVDDSATVDEGQTVTVLDSADDSVLDNDSDLEGDSLTANTTPVSDPSHGLLTLRENGTFSYTHDGGETTGDSFTYQVCDDGTPSKCDIATVSIIVDPVNDAPMANNDNYNVSGDSLSIAAPGVLVNDTDPDDGTLTAVLVDDTAHGTLTLNPDGSFTYIHDGSETVTDSFTYRANDGTADSNVAVVNLTISADNDPPIANDDNYTVDEGDTLVIEASGVLTNDTDPDDDPLTAVLISGVTNGTLTLNPDGSFTYDHDGSETITDSFTYQANDGAADSNLATVNLTVNPVNDAPVASDDDYNVDEGDTLTVEASGVLANDADPDDDPLTAILVSSTAHGTLTLNPDGSFTYIHDGSETFTDSFTYQASDGSVGSNIATVSIVVNAENDAPMANNDSYSIDEGGTLTVTASGVLANDIDSDDDTLIAILLGNVTHGALILNPDGSFTYIHDGGETVTDSFTYQANDGSADSNVATVSITIDADNDAPTASDDSFSVDEGGTITVTAPGVLGNDTDPDSDTLTAVMINNVAHGTLVLNADGSFIYTHNGSETTEDSFTYQVNDGIADSNIGTVNITVKPVNDAPIVNDDGYSVDEGATLTVTAPGVLLNDTDSDGDTLAAILTSGADQGMLTLHPDGSFVYVHDGSEISSDSFTYQGCDDGLPQECSIGTVNITVNPENDPPSAVDDDATTDEGIVVAIDVLNNDTDPEGDTLTVESVSAPSSGSAGTDGVTITYTPTLGFIGIDAFTYTISDGNGGTDVATVRVNVEVREPELFLIYLPVAFKAH